MKNYGKKAIGVGVATLLVTGAASMNASAATSYNYRSYAEAQYLQASGALLGDALVDPLVDFLEGGELGASDSVAGAAAKVNTAAGTAATDGPYETATPLDALVGNTGLTGQLGTGLLNPDAGAVGAFALIQDANTKGAAGAVANGGLADLDTATSDDFGHLQLSLAGPDSPLAALSALANLTIDLGAVGSQTQAVPVDANDLSQGVKIENDYELAGGKIVLEVPALAGLLGPLLGLSDATDGGTDISNDLLGQLEGVPVLGDLLSGLLGGLISLLPTGGTSNVDLGLIGGVPELLDSLTTLESAGLIIDLETGTVTIDIDALLSTVDLGNLPHNTALLPQIIEGVTAALPGLVSGLVDELTAGIGNLTLLTLPLGQILEGVLGTVVQPLVDGVVTPLLETISTQLAPALTGVLDQLAPLLDIRVNVQSNSDESIADAGNYEGSIADRVEDYDHSGSTTALRITVLSAVGDSPALALNLGNSFAAADDPTPVVVTDADANAVANADAVANANADANANANANVNANGGYVDGVVDTLPSAGAPNLTPFWLLGLALVLFGSAVLVNEKRRMAQS